MTILRSSADDALAQMVVEAQLDEDWALWLAVLFPDYCTYPFGDHHVGFWEWVWSIGGADRPRPFVAIWPRGGAKSTSAEMACVAFAARRRRRYGLVVCETQEQADDHVGNVGAMLESERVGAFYPVVSERLVGKYGHSKGWRRNRLRTASGFTLDALGLDTAARGVKIDDARPDLMVFDDIDSETDSAQATEKKVHSITHKILPARAEHCAVLAIQNLVLPQGVFARLAGSADKPADFLVDRIVSGPIPAIQGMTYVERDGRFVLVDGHPSWEGQSISACQDQIDTFGISSFLSESQHMVEARPGGMYDHIVWKRIAESELPELVRVAVWVDPAVSDTDQSDSMGIQADGIGVDDVIYRLRSWEQRSSPLVALCKAIRWALELGADHVGVETDQGGDTWRSVYREACEVVRQEDGYDGSMPLFRWEKAGAGYGSKTHRSQQMLADYERPGRIVHVEGYHLVLERSLERFPRTKPHDLADAAFWSWRELRPAGGMTTLTTGHLRGQRIPTGVGATRRNGSTLTSMNGNGMRR